MRLNLRDKRAVLLGLLALVLLLFGGGMAIAWTSRHDTVCPDGKLWVKKYDNGMLGQSLYLCHNGVTVTK